MTLYSYHIDGTTDNWGNLFCGGIDIKGYPLCFIPEFSGGTNYPCNVIADQTGGIYIKPINNDWQATYTGLPGAAIKGTLYCVK